MFDRFGSAVAVSGDTVVVGANTTQGSAYVFVDNSVNPTLTSIAVTPASPTIAAGANQQMTATGTYSDGSNARSSPTRSPGPRARPRSPPSPQPGSPTASPRARARSRPRWARSRARRRSPSAAPTLISIAVTPASPTIAAGANQQMTATGTYSDGSNPEHHRLGHLGLGLARGRHRLHSGLAHGVAAGTSSISATLGAISG